MVNFENFRLGLLLAFTKVSFIILIGPKFEQNQLFKF